MVQVQSTWFPVIDRNPQRFVAHIFHLTEADFQPATQPVFRSPGHASHILLPVVDKGVDIFSRSMHYARREGDKAQILFFPGGLLNSLLCDVIAYE